MTIFVEFMVTDAQLAALKAAAATRDGILSPGNGIRWNTIQAMARRDWVTITGPRTSRLLPRGSAMIRIGTEERERHAQRASRRSMARSIDPFALIARTTHHA